MESRGSLDDRPLTDDVTVVHIELDYRVTKETQLDYDFEDEESGVGDVAIHAVGQQRLQDNTRIVGMWEIRKRYVGIMFKWPDLLRPLESQGSNFADPSAPADTSRLAITLSAEDKTQASVVSANDDGAKIIVEFMDGRVAVSSKGVCVCVLLVGLRADVVQKCSSCKNESGR
jgi:hypothetical protein